MPLGMFFWTLMLAWAVFSVVSWRAPDRLGGYGYLGNSLLVLVLLGVLGWQVFGPAVK
jgi:hypothetical protein